MQSNHLDTLMSIFKEAGLKLSKVEERQGEVPDGCEVHVGTYVDTGERCEVLIAKHRKVLVKSFSVESENGHSEAGFEFDENNKLTGVWGNVPY